MAKLYPGPPHHFRCCYCEKKFRRMIKWGIYCPYCKSLRVVTDFTVKK